MLHNSLNILCSLQKLLTGIDSKDLLKYSVIIVAILACVFLFVRVEGVRWFAVVSLVLVIGFSGVYSGIKLNQYYSAEGGIYGKIDDLLKNNEVTVEQDKTRINFNFKSTNLTEDLYGNYSAHFQSSDVIKLDSTVEYFVLVNDMPCQIIEYDTFHFIAEYYYSFYSIDGSYILTDKLTFTFAFSHNVTDLYVSTSGGTEAVDLWNVYFSKNDFIVNFETTDYVYNSKSNMINLFFYVDEELYANIDVDKNNISYTLDNPTKENCTFVGWSVNGYDALKNLESSIENGIVSYYAVFEDDLLVTFKVDDVNYSLQYVPYNNYVDLPINPTKENYVFTGWSLDRETVIDNIETIAVTEPVTYIAVFKICSYSVNYMVEDNLFSSQAINYGSCAVLPDNPIKIGYEFLGWSLDGETVIDNIETIAVTEPVTYIAVFEEIIYFTFEYNSSGYYTLTGVTSNYTNTILDIPSTYDDGVNGLKNVGSIGEYVLQQGSNSGTYLSSITEVIIPENVVMINSYAFYGCFNITSVTFEARTKYITINYYAFYGCSIANVYCTENTESEATTYIKNNINSTGNSNLTGATWHYWEDNVTDYMTFSYSSTGGGYYTLTAVDSGYDRSTITVPSTYNDGTYHGLCKVKYIGNGSLAVLKSSSYTSIIIPEGVVGIKDAAFTGSSLKTVSIPSTVTSIGSNAFSSCSKISNVCYGGTINNWSSNITFGNAYSNPMTNANSTASFYTKDTDSSYGSSTTTYNGSTYRKIVSPTITSSTINAYAFSYFTQLTAITLSGSLQDIGTSAFYQCSGLTNVYYNSTMSDWNQFVTLDGLASNPMYYASSSAVFWTTDTNTSMGFVTTYVNGIIYRIVSNLLTSAFDNYNIKDYQFAGFRQLTNINLSNSGTGSTIGNYAFANCTGLTSLTIPDEYTTIETNAFSNTSSLTTLYFEERNCELTIKLNAFFSSKIDTIWYKSDVENKVLYLTFEDDSEDDLLQGDVEWKYYYSVYQDYMTFGSLSYTDEYGEEQEGLALLIVSKSYPSKVLDVPYYNGDERVNVIGPNVLINGYTSGDMPAEPTSTIKTSYYASKITKVLFHEYIYAISDYAFCNCTNLTTVLGGAGVSSLGCYAFSGSGLSSISSSFGSSSLIEILDGSFKNTAFTSFTFSSNIAFIGSYAFNGCSNLTTVNFETRTISFMINSNAFANCSALANVYCGNIETDAQTYIKSNINSTGNSCLTDATWYYDSNLNSANLSASNVSSNNMYNVCYNLAPVILGKNYTLDNLPTAA